MAGRAKRAGAKVPKAAFPEVEDVLANEAACEAIQLLVDACCDGEEEHQRRALGVLLARLAACASAKKRRPVFAFARPKRKPETEVASEEVGSELDGGREDEPDPVRSTAKRNTIRAQELVDLIVAETLLPQYRLGHRSFVLPTQFRGQGVPVDGALWETALSKVGIGVGNLAFSVDPGSGRQVLNLSGIATPGSAIPAAAVFHAGPRRHPRT